MPLYTSYGRVSGEETSYSTVCGHDIFGLRPHEIKCLAKYTAWTDITNKILSFNVKRAGFLFIPYARLRLENEDGYFTKGTYNVGLNRQIILRAKYHDAWYQLIKGRVHEFGEEPTLGTYPIEAETEFLIRSFGGQKLLNDTISKNYMNEGFSCRQAIDDMLEKPDSGVDTGLRLLTDEGIIHNELAPQNFLREKLVDAIKIIADEIGYDGNIIEEANLIVLKAIATEIASPPVSFYHELLRLKPEFDKDEVHNHIFVWGKEDLGWPVNDLWCEYGANRFSPAAWSGLDANSVITNDTTYKTFGVNAIRVTRKNSTGPIKAILDIQKTGYIRPQNPVKDTMDLTDDRFIVLKFKLRPNGFDLTLHLQLYDTAGKKTTWDAFPSGYSGGSWASDEAGVDSDCLDERGCQADWIDDPGFNWGDIAKIHIGCLDSQAIDSFITIDELIFEGNNWLINPKDKPTYCAAHTDATSINLYERKVHHLTEYQDEIHCFEHAYILGQLYLNVHKNPFKKIKVRSGFKPWLKPHNVVKLGMPEWGIYNEDWRIIELEHDWNSERKICYTTVEIVPASWILPTATALKARLGGFLKTVSS